jgi:stage V sporulation protein G
MNITDVKVFPVEEEKLKAYATITLDNCFIVRDLKVISGNKGYFIAMPSKKRKDGTFRDVAHPLNSETRKMIEDAVLEVYEREAAAVSEVQPSTTIDAATTDLEETVVEEEASPLETEPVSSETEGQGAEAAEADQEPIVEPVTDQEPTEGPAPDQEPTEEPVMESSASAEEEPEKKPVDNPSIEPSQDPEKAFGYEE